MSSLSKKALRLAAICAVGLLAAGAVLAQEEILVRPQDLKVAGSTTGWITIAYRGEGTTTYEKSRGACWDGFTNAAGQMPPIGYGSFWMKVFPYYGQLRNGPCGGRTFGNPGDDDMPRVLLGTNELNGVLLKDIESISYYSCLTNRDYWGGSGGTPYGQPPMVQIYTDSGHTTQQRIFAYFPFGAPPGRSSATGSYDTEINKWQYNNATNDFTSHWEMYNNTSSNYFGDFYWVQNRYYDSVNYPADYPKIIKPPTAGGISDEYPNKCATGAGFNIKIGSYKLSEANRADWWKESTGVEGYVDAVHIVWVKDGVRYDKTWNFDLGSLMGTTNRGAYDRAIGWTQSYDVFPGCASPGTVALPFGGRHHSTYEVWGTVLADGFDLNNFKVDDGSGKPISVLCRLDGDVDLHGVNIGDFVKATGAIDNTVTPPTLVVRKADIVSY